MTATVDTTALPLPPRIPLPVVQQLRKLRDYHTGGELVRDLCGPVARATSVGFRDFDYVFVTSPQGAHDVLAAPRGVVDKDALHRDAALWPDPLRFDPERSTPENAQGRDRWQFIPFGGGSRSCIGDHFAMLEATLGLASLVRAAEFTSEHAEFPMELPFTLTAKGPIPARVRARARATHITPLPARARAHPDVAGLRRT